jgi:RNA polymerase sigma factor for flagellar operon FliA
VSTLQHDAPSRRGRISQSEALALWRRYQATGDQQLRTRLNMTFAPLVKYIVYRRIRELPAHQEADDYISRGLEAMIVSIDRYDPDRGATLEQYLWTRIHGAVLDEMRSQDWAPRSVRRFARQAGVAARNFRAVHGREATPQELADALAVPVEELQAHRSDLARSDVDSLNRSVQLGDDSGGEAEHIETLASVDRRADPEQAAMLSDVKREVRAGFDTLSEREREVLVLLYVKHLTLSEIGTVIGVSESRVSQIHSGIRRKLRERLSGHEDALDLLGA